MLEVTLDVTSENTATRNVDIFLDGYTSKLLLAEGMKVIKVTKDVLEELEPKGTASGQMKNSLRVSQVYKDASIYKVRAGSPMKYSIDVEKGKKPLSAKPPEQTILEWMNYKGILPRYGSREQAAKAIANKIGKQGIPALKFFEMALYRYKRGIR